MPSGTPATRTPTYVEEQRRLVLARLRQACGLGLVVLGISAIGNCFAFFHDRLWEHLATHVVQASIMLVTWLLARRPWAERAAPALAVGIALAMGTTLFWSINLSAADLDVLVGPLTIVMVLPTLLFPWGIAPQLVVSLYLAAGYLLLLPWTALAATRIANVLISLSLGVAASVIGAWVINRQRRVNFGERERVETLAREREMLLEAGRELNGTLEVPELVDRITRLGHRLVGSDSAALTLAHADGTTLRVAAVSSDRPGSPDGLIGAEFTAADFAPLLDEIRRRGTLEIPSGTALDDRLVPFMQRYGVARTLYVAIERDGTALGHLHFSQRAAEPPFGADRVRLAQGIAHQAAVALANARLVSDLQRASRVKSEFVSTMSHELRTPLHVIMGYADMLEEAPAGEQPAMIEKVRQAGRELLELIDATLNLNRLDSGQDEPTFGRLDLGELWHELAGEFATLPRKPGVALRWHAVDGIALLTDRRKLKIVLKNLVGNALKFTAAGGIDVACVASGPHGVFSVRDTGCGIRAEHLPLIFEMFRQVDSSDTRSYGGVGLGLYIVNRLTSQLGGTVAVDSTPGAGTTFTVTLPGIESAAPPRQAAG